MKKGTKRTIMIGILILIIILLSILIINTTKQMPNTVEEQAKAGYTTQIGGVTYDITNAVTATPNIPTISAGMIPVKWDGTYWTITTKDDNTWYDYANGKPAYIMLNDGTYQSELVRDMANKKLAEDNIGAQIQEAELGSVYMWIPRFAYNEQGEILHIKQSHSVAGTWTIPDVFIYETDKKDFSLAGLWVEYNPLVSTSEVTIKVNNMSVEENIYGLIANTKSMSMTDTDLTAIEQYSVGAGQALALNDTTNLNRTILKIINTNEVEPIKGIATLNADELTITVEVTYKTNAISKILDENGNILSANSTTAVDSNLLGNGTYKYIVVDNVGNMREIQIKAEGLKIYVIPNLQRLKEFRDEVNAGNNFSGITVIQTADININEGKYTIDSTTGEITFASDAEQWEPIGDNRTTSIRFAGTYDGGGHIISGIYIDSDLEYRGLFGCAPYGTIKNLNIEKSKILSTERFIGAIAGDVKFLENCSSSAQVIGSTNVGGLIGGLASNGYITNSYNKGIVIGNSSYIGGICGNTYSGSITNCYNTGNVTSLTSGYVGGIIGGQMNNDTFEVKNCYNYGNISGNYYVAGISGHGNGESTLENCYNIGQIAGDYGIAGILGFANSYTTITNCYNVGSVNSSYNSGGIIGLNNDINAKVINCYNTGDIIATSTSNYSSVGGIVGNMGSRIRIVSCYNTGNITGNSSYTGGIAGYHSGTVTGGKPESWFTLNNSYNSGKVSGINSVGGIAGYYRGNNYTTFPQNYNMGEVTGTNYIGGIIGRVYNTSYGCSNCYYETGTASYGVGDRTSGNNTGCTSTTRENILSYITALDEYQDDTYNINNGLPILSWQTDNDKFNLINGDNAFVEDTNNINNGYPLLAWQVQ